MANKDYNNIFSLNNQTAFIVGGQGLLGSEITKAISSQNANTIVLDINTENSYESKGVHCLKFDCSDLKNLETAFISVINEFGCPDIFINCSYPRTEDWTKNTFEEISLESYKQNIDIHLNSYVWLAKLAANQMVNNEKKGSIIQFGSFYG